MYDWFNILKRLRKKIFSMTQRGVLYGYIVREIAGHYVVILVRKKDVYLEEGSDDTKRA